MRPIRILVPVLVVMLALAAGRMATPARADTVPEGWARVTHLVDGDTADVQLGDGSTARVRLYGINTPERGEPCFAEATDALGRLLTDNGRDWWAYLETGPRAQDRYDRALAYLWVADGESWYLVGEWMTWLGYAHAWTADGQYRERIIAAEADAAASGRGCLWSGGAAPRPAAASSNTTTTTTATGRAGCDPAYPDVCIPSPPPDLDCGDIPYRHFRVLPPDPHRFDGRDQDGIGCEN